MWKAVHLSAANETVFRRCCGGEVVTTASPKIFHYVRKLGASQVFDYNDAHVIATIVKFLGSHEMAVALAISAGSGALCVEVMARC